MNTRKPAAMSRCMSDRLISFAGQPAEPADVTGAAAVWQAAALFAIAESIREFTALVREIAEQDRPGGAS
jgi:hypothetical protein